MVFGPNFRPQIQAVKSMNAFNHHLPTLAKYHHKVSRPVVWPEIPRKTQQVVYSEIQSIDCSTTKGSCIKMLAVAFLQSLQPISSSIIRDHLSGKHYTQQTDKVAKDDPVYTTQVKSNKASPC